MRASVLKLSFCRAGVHARVGVGRPALPLFVGAARGSVPHIRRCLGRAGCCGRGREPTSNALRCAGEPLAAAAHCCDHSWHPLAGRHQRCNHAVLLPALLMPAPLMPTTTIIESIKSSLRVVSKASHCDKGRRAGAAAGAGYSTAFHAATWYHEQGPTGTNHADALNNADKTDVLPPPVRLNKFGK